jgi:hypothetical protein
MKPLPELKRAAKKHFNAYIRKRDQDEGCITCGAKIEHACHLYPANIYWWLEFDEVNTNGGCRNCNYYDHPVNQHKHSAMVRQRYGFDEWAALIERATGTRTNEKRDRHFFQDIIDKYRVK